MSYTKNTWKSGDIVTSAKLNNMENGIAAANNGSIPSFTNSDGGKVLSLKPTGETSNETITIIQQQTVSTESHGIGHLANETFDMSWMTQGDTATINLNGTEETYEVIRRDDSLVLVKQDSDLTIFISTGEVWWDEGSATLSISGTAQKHVDIVAPTWSKNAENILAVQIIQDNNRLVMNKTWKEMKDCFNAGGNVIVCVNNGIICQNLFITHFISEEYELGIATINPDTLEWEPMIFFAEDEDDYPYMQIENQYLGPISD